MSHLVIYDGTCNLCLRLVQLLERLDQGRQLRYAPMQDQETLSRFDINTQDCEQGMILVDIDSPERRWRGSEAIEEIGRLLPLGDQFIRAYRALPGLKKIGDHGYEMLRDRRYALFGQRSTPYQSNYPLDKSENHQDGCPQSKR